LEGLLVKFHGLSIYSYRHKNDEQLLHVFFVSVQRDCQSSHAVLLSNDAVDNLTTLPHFNNQKPAAVSTYAQINNKPVKFLSKFQAVAKRKI